MPELCIAEWLNSRQVRERLGVTRQRVHQLRELLGARRAADKRTWLYPAANVDRLIEGRDLVEVQRINMVRDITSAKRRAR
jgi:hypothetical protein